MFKPGRWRSEKEKQKFIKVDFKLQFHATQVAQLGADGLMLSIVPGDVGKPTVKLEKSTVKDGVCEWKDPVYESVKLTREPKTGKINEKIYYFVVAQGSSKASVVDKVTMNFADYAEATKASSVSFPLKNSSMKAVLHVMIQKILENADQREVEDNVDTKVKAHGRSLRSHLSRGDKDEESIKSNSTEEAPLDKSPHDVALSGNFRTSSGSDLTISSSESSSGLNTPRELGMGSTIIRQEPSPFISSPRPMSRPTADALVRISEEHQRSRLQWSGSFCREEISDGPEAHQRENSGSASDAEIEILKAEISSLARQAGMAELELQTLRKQIVKESKRSQDLFKENIGLKEDRDALEVECENLKVFHKWVAEAKVKNKLQNEDGDLHSLLNEIRQELTHEKNLNANLRLQLEKTQESNAELILAVKDLDEMLEQKNREISDFSTQKVVSKTTQLSKGDLSKCETSDDEEQSALEEIIKQHKDAKEMYVLEQRIMDLNSEIEIYRRDKDELGMQMEQLALDYEILKQKNHELSYKLEQSELQEHLKQQYDYSLYPNLNEQEHEIETLENDLEKKSKEFSDSLATINELQINIQNLRHDLERKSEDYLQSAATISELESENKTLKINLDQKLRDYSISLANISELECCIETLKGDLERTSRDYLDSAAKIGKLEGNIETLRSDLERKSKDHSDALFTINEYESIIETLKSDLERKSKDYSDSLITINELESNIESLKNDLERKSRNYSDSLATINELEKDMENVKEDLKRKPKDVLDSLTVNKELETQINNLEAQLEEQAKEFEADLDIITRAKVEQEQRAIKAEDGLRKMRLKNVDTAERLQEEFRRLSMQMASTFDANEKLAMKALAEASKLRMRNSQLAEMLHKANMELRSTKADYEAELSKLPKEMQMKNDYIEKMTLQIDETTKELKQQKNCVNEVNGTLSEELAMLQSEIGKLTIEKNSLLEQVAQNGNLMKELERMRRSIEEAELVMQRGKEERNEIVSALALMRKELSGSMEELHVLRHMKDEKNIEVQSLESELMTLKVQCNDMKQSILDDELEKENLRKQLFQLKKDLKKKENALTTLEKKRLRERNGHLAISDATKGVVRNKKSAAAVQSNKEMAGLQEKINSLESLIRLKEAALEASANSFLEKEEDLRKKIDDLESRLEEANQNYINLDKRLIETVAEGNDASSTKDVCHEYMPIENGDVTNRENEVVSEQETKTSTAYIHESDADVSTELASLREINKSMQTELKELQEKYSEMSLKFAEVEGERQKLVMHVRTLKNAKRG